MTVVAAMQAITTPFVWWTGSCSEVSGRFIRTDYRLRRNAMKIKTAFAIVLMAGWCMTAWAGSISGKVSGMKGRSVVYVDTIAGKTFPAPKEHPVMDQKGLLFSPHILAVQQGTTVEFLN